MSLGKSLLPLAIRVSGRRGQWRSDGALRSAVARRQPWPAVPPRLHDISVVRTEGDPWPQVAIVPPDSSAGVYVHLHGGGYVFGPAAQHWPVLRELALASRRTVIVPLYRLAPEGVAAETVPVAAALVRELADGADLVLGGDSAGGGLALAVAQRLAADGIRVPLALVAPWVDATLDDDATRAADRRDPWLSAPGLRAAAELYRGALPVTHPFVSPVAGPLAGLGPAVIITGTRDVLHPQAVALASALAEAGTPAALHVGDGLLHNIPFLPIPEARPYRRVLADLLRRA